MIRDKQKAGRFCVLALAGGNSPRNVYSALVRMHKEEGLSFRNVVVFNLYEYYPLASDAVNSNLNSLKEMLLDHVDIDMQNVFSPQRYYRQRYYFRILPFVRATYRKFRRH